MYSGIINIFLKNKDILIQKWMKYDMFLVINLDTNLWGESIVTLKLLVKLIPESLL